MKDELVTEMRQLEAQMANAGNWERAKELWSRPYPFNLLAFDALQAVENKAVRPWHVYQLKAFLREKPPHLVYQERKQWYLSWFGQEVLRYMRYQQEGRDITGRKT